MLDTVMTLEHYSKAIRMATHEVHKRMPKVNCGVSVKRVVGAGEVAVGVVFGNALDNAFDQATVASFAVFVEEGFAFGAED